jgi:hypothetical protein
MSNIISLRETSPNHWRARYQGNYGIYTICVTTDGEETVDFSCSCPSGYYPCKHIAMIEEAIAEKMANTKKAGKKKEVGAGELLKILSREELYDFIVKQTQYNPELANAVFLEFSHKIENKHQNKYSLILRRSLETIELNEDDYSGDEEWIDLDILDRWFEKAHHYLEKNNFREAVLIAQACIEEFALWLQKSESELREWVGSDYQSIPFKIIETAISGRGVNVKELYDYCRAELPKKKYAGTYMYEGFQDLLMRLSMEVDPDAFIALQNELLEAVADKRSGEAETILRREIEFYTMHKKPEMVWKIIGANIQIHDFRKMLAEKKIADRDYGTAKKLIHDLIDTKEFHGGWHPTEWDDLLLKIAKEEKDVPTLREISRLCIEGGFRKSYYTIYKATFRKNEWVDALEGLIDHYEKKDRYFSDSVADVLAIEKDAERLLRYIEKYLDINSLEKYHAVFAPAFPEETLALFRLAIDRYAEDYVGRSYYNHIADLLEKMSHLDGGKKVVKEMVDDYRIRYKNRRAMLEILNGLSKPISPHRKTGPRQ